MQEPSPETVTTVATLAYELRLLKIHMGDPSVRELSRTAARAGLVLPHSTAQDALGGKRGLPRMDTVIALVTALGAADVGPWRDAWRRAGQHHRGLVGRDPGAPPAPGPRAAPAVRGTRISVVNAARGADLIEALPLDDAVAQVAEMSEDAAARRLDLVRPPRAAEVLAEMDDFRAGRILGSMRPDLAAAALAVMRPSAAARLVDEMPSLQRDELARWLTTEQSAAIRAEG